MRTAEQSIPEALSGSTARQTAIQLEFGATNTPSQNGVSERIGRTLSGMTRSLLLDSGLPNHLWGELTPTAAYLSNRSLHSALDMETPYKKLHGKEADLSLLEIIGARAFVHIEAYTKNLGNKAWEGRFCGCSQESKTYRVYNPETRKVVEGRNVAFIETPPHIVPPPDDSAYQASGWIPMNDNDELYNNDDHLLRDIRDYTSRIDLNNNSDQTIQIDPPAGAELAEILTRLCGVISRESWHWIEWRYAGRRTHK